ncbi:uncharacterized protein B0H18DRAFT_65223 [Fomitopsis serialis]|uniref:uncharacterized protein n=1 Tax=Fomitopsis serialis TaxID=139415 RepID=UPI002008A57C|nr:uncharacterized protein B0H18DRAFT_65223 [Neoantrodia serialis]KAH9916472.1 hypothetical protein B0H18DRAFT_65223 [Neoantrodia serialis]
MSFSGYTLPVNPPDAPLRLTTEQLFAGLKTKARDPLAFVPMITSCAVLEEHPDGLLREVVLKGKPGPVHERVEYFPSGNVVFTMLDPATGDKLGVITNTITETPEGELMLTFTFTFGQGGPWGSGPASDEQRKERDKLVVDTMRRTLEVTRQYVQEKKI